MTYTALGTHRWVIEEVAQSSNSSLRKMERELSALDPTPPRFQWNGEAGRTVPVEVDPAWAVLGVIRYELGFRQQVER